MHQARRFYGFANIKWQQGWPHLKSIWQGSSKFAFLGRSFPTFSHSQKLPPLSRGIALSSTACPNLHIFHEAGYIANRHLQRSLRCWFPNRDNSKTIGILYFPQTLLGPDIKKALIETHFISRATQRHHKIAVDETHHQQTWQPDAKPPQCDPVACPICPCQTSRPCLTCMVHVQHMCGFFSDKVMKRNQTLYSPSDSA